MTTIGEATLQLRADTAQFRAQMQGAADRFQRAGQRMRGVGSTLSTRVTLPLLAIGGAALTVASDFESGMNRVRGLTGATGDEFEALNEQAQELGRTTAFSASQAADAMGFLGMAGFETTEILGAMPGVLNLAAAAQLELGQAADIVSNVLTGYGLAVSELGTANDIMVATTTSANTNMAQLGEAFREVGPIASDIGLEFTEVAAAIGVMGDAGIQGSTAGTALRVGLGRLLNPTAQVTGALSDLGLSMEQVNPETNSLTQIIGALEDAGAGAGDILAIFGQRGAAIAPLISQGREAVAQLEGTLRDSGGAAEDMANVQMEGLRGALTRLKSATEGLFIAISEAGLIDWATGLAESLTNLVSGLAETNPTLLKLGTVAAGVVAVLGPLLTMAGAMFAAISALTPVFAAVAAVMASPLLVPIAGVVAAVGGLVAAFFAFRDEITTAVNAVVNVVGPMIQEFVGSIQAAWVTARDNWITPIIDFVTDAAEWLNTQLFSVLDSVLEFFDKMPGFMEPPLVRAARAARDFGRDVSREMVRVRDEMQGRVVDEGIAAVMGGFGEMGDEVPAITEDMTDAVTEEFERMSSDVSNSTDRMVDSVSDQMSRLSQNISRVLGRVVDRVREFRNDFVDGMDRTFRIMVNRAGEKFLELETEAITGMGKVSAAVSDPNAWREMHDAVDEGMEEWRRRQGEGIDEIESDTRSGVSRIGEAWGRISNVLRSPLLGDAGAFAVVVDETIRFVDDLLGAFKLITEDLPGLVDDIVAGIRQIGDALSGANQSIGQIGDGVPTGDGPGGGFPQGGGPGDAIGGLGGLAGGIVSGLISGITTAITSAIEIGAMRQGMQAIVDQVHLEFSALREHIQPHMVRVRELLSEIEKWGRFLNSHAKNIWGQLNTLVSSGVTIANEVLTTEIANLGELIAGMGESFSADTAAIVEAIEVSAISIVDAISGIEIDMPQPQSVARAPAAATASGGGSSGGGGGGFVVNQTFQFPSGAAATRSTIRDAAFEGVDEALGRARQRGIRRTGDLGVRRG